MNTSVCVCEGEGGERDFDIYYVHTFTCMKYVITQRVRTRKDELAKLTQVMIYLKIFQLTLWTSYRFGIGFKLAYLEFHKYVHVHCRSNP